MDDELEEAVPAAFDGDRLDRFVAAISGRSRAAVKQLIVDGQVTVDGRVTRTPAGRIETGAIVSVRLPTEVAETPAPDPGVPFEVVHEDADIVIVDKPTKPVNTSTAANAHAAGSNSDGAIAISVPSAVAAPLPPRKPNHTG